MGNEKWLPWIASGIILVSGCNKKDNSCKLPPYMPKETPVLVDETVQKANDVIASGEGDLERQTEKIISIIKKHIEEIDKIQINQESYSIDDLSKNSQTFAENLYTNLTSEFPDIDFPDTEEDSSPFVFYLYKLLKERGVFLNMNLKMHEKHVLLIIDLAKIEKIEQMSTEPYKEDFLEKFSSESRMVDVIFLDLPIVEMNNPFREGRKLGTYSGGALPKDYDNKPNIIFSPKHLKKQIPPKFSPDKQEKTFQLLQSMTLSHELAHIAFEECFSSLSEKEKYDLKFHYFSISKRPYVYQQITEVYACYEELKVLQKESDPTFLLQNLYSIVFAKSPIRRMQQDFLNHIYHHPDFYSELKPEHQFDTNAEFWANPDIPLMYKNLIVKIFPYGFSQVVEQNFPAMITDALDSIQKSRERKNN